MAEQPTLQTVLDRIGAIEGKIITEARIKEICGESATTAIATWAGSEAGKKIIGSEASRITAEALANVGTTPAKPAPVGAAGNDTPEQKASALIAEGKFEEAFKLDANIRREFVTGKSYAAYMKNQGSVRINSRPKDANRN